MEKEIAFVEYMVDTFGVRSCFDNIDEDNPIEEEGVWFECPVCGEIVDLINDYNLNEVIERCPICEEKYEED